MVHTTVDSRWDAAVAPILALAERRFGRAKSLSQSFHLDAGELGAHLNGDRGTASLVEGAASRGSDGDATVTIIVLAPRGRPALELQALAQLANEAARTTIANHAIAASLDFWRTRAALNAERMAEAGNLHTAAAAEQALIESTVTACLKLQPRNRFMRLGTILAGVGPFDAWLIANAAHEPITIVAASAALGPTPQLDPAGTLADTIRRGAIVLRKAGATTSATCAEDRLFVRYPSYVCAPFTSGAIVLAAHAEIGRALMDRVGTLTRRLSPMIEKWFLQDQLDNLQRLVRTLGVRLFTAIDGERRRIARDLHDHQAQLLAAARIALEADPAEARAILKQLDEVLRRHVRALRPATLGRASLRVALRHEIRRLSTVGIKARLLYPAPTKALSRPVQQLCYQVVGEAFSNVLRHADATEVTVALENRDGLARIVIDDNGKGISTAKAKAATGESPGGVGLIGLAERVELLGGKFRLERVDAITRLTAEIPEL